MGKLSATAVKAATRPGRIALTDADRHRSTKATRPLAIYLAERLGCFEVIAKPYLTGVHHGLFEMSPPSLQ
ncbi:MAG: hypothetical protein Q8R44_10545 [Novosphingobium sp.]|nr:hypothetical protein [Novosphingobium sp.]